MRITIPVKINILQPQGIVWKGLILRNAGWVLYQLSLIHSSMKIACIIWNILILVNQKLYLSILPESSKNNETVTCDSFF